MIGRTTVSYTGGVRYIALLRGVNVGGNNIVSMAELRWAFERAGFANVSTYINSGNVIFDSDASEGVIRDRCQDLLSAQFSLSSPLALVSGPVLGDTVANAPSWWNQDPDSRHNAIFVIPPLTPAKVCAQIGQTDPEIELISWYGPVIFWSAPRATSGRSRLSRIVTRKDIYNLVTIRNANTTLKLAGLSADPSPAA